MLNSLAEKVRLRWLMQNWYNDLLEHEKELELLSAAVFKCRRKNEEGSHGRFMTVSGSS